MSKSIATENECECNVCGVGGIWKGENGNDADSQWDADDTCNDADDEKGGHPWTDKGIPEIIGYTLWGHYQPL